MDSGGTSLAIFARTAAVLARIAGPDDCIAARKRGKGSKGNCLCGKLQPNMINIRDWILPDDALPSLF